MKTFDQYSSVLLEQSKRFLEKAKLEKSDEGKQAYLIAALLISFCSLEAFVNGVVSDFAEWNKLTVHEKGLLLEKIIRFESGNFVMSDALQMSRLKDKIELLLKKFHCRKTYKKDNWWGELSEGFLLRNSLSHPKEARQLKEEQVERVIKSITECLDFVFRTIYKKGFPSKKMDSRLSF